MESTQTQAPAVATRQERQLIAGRYRLASFHRGDESTEVWRALDETTTRVVSLEFLRESDPASKERFLGSAPPRSGRAAVCHAGRSDSRRP